MVILSTAALVVLGLVMVFSASSVTAFVEQGDAYGETIKQIIFALIGVAICVGVIIASKAFGFEFMTSKFVVYAFWGLCVLGILATAALGKEALGAKRWLYIGPVSIQVAEFMKIALVLMSARIMIEFNEGMDALKVFVRCAIFIVAPLALALRASVRLGYHGHLLGGHLCNSYPRRRAGSLDRTVARTHRSTRCCGDCGCSISYDTLSHLPRSVGEC